MYKTPCYTTFGLRGVGGGGGGEGTEETWTLPSFGNLTWKLKKNHLSECFTLV